MERSTDNEFYRMEQLSHLVVIAKLSCNPPPDTMLRLMDSVMEHQAGQLQD